MRSLVFTALLGSFVASTTLIGQSLTEHAAAAAGATIGTAAGKPLGTTLGKIFGDVDKTSSAAATPKTTKPVADKPAPAKPAAPETTAHANTVPHPSVGGGEASGGSGSGSSARASEAPAHHAARQKEPSIQPEAPIVVAVVPVFTPPVVKEPTAEDVGRIQVGATSSELHETLGAAESTVSIPGDDGHLLEIRQYWSNGAPVGTVRLDNGRVVSVNVKTGN